MLVVQFTVTVVSLLAWLQGPALQIDIAKVGFIIYLLVLPGAQSRMFFELYHVELLFSDRASLHLL
jgi:hypothetical protein